MAFVNASMAMSGDGSIVRPAEAERALASGVATSVGYRIEREQIPEAIADFQRALMALDEAEQEALKHDRIIPPGGDPYSKQAVQTMGPELVSNYRASNHRDKANIEAMIENLDAAMRQYDAQEDAAALSFRPEV
ncbi:hypothetical protein DFQ14_11348 [Halopolyspora algeriensis]|uniref:PE family protein n=1 Tax=Halopolyspora algeriensis TaxID=1500506 RepID=A0A368VFV0_9ACTN|nr:hypothetical protein [Halopolyspora algeriensis]RCW39966.1 hypothetical protein DFQ14_11348 [Halopolyspora algeriensis]TQM46597.1 hypothetical protein FHU43_3714 [Halopolyspora algeriensis]